MVVTPTVFMRLTGPSKNFVELAQDLCSRGFAPSLLLERSDSIQCWVEIETEGTVEDLDGLCPGIESLTQRHAFTIREYGAQLTPAVR